MNEIQTQYGVTPKIFRTDNALEFVQAPIASLCAERGIIHQTTCPHTSQQNGVAERKHRHILDVARSLLAEMHVPRYLWSDAVATAAYLINHLPSSPLGGAIPFDRLFPDKETFLLQPRIFGCTAFVKDLSLGLDKLAHPSLRCVFVGYPRTQKGYRCYHPPSKRYLVSTDVHFLEDLPFFSPVSTNSGVFEQAEDIPTPLADIFPVSSLSSDSPTFHPPLVPSGSSFPSRLGSPYARIYHHRSAPVVPASSSTDADHLPVALRKGTRACTSHSISYYISHDPYTLAILSESIPKHHSDSLTLPEWKRAMDYEM
jgi:hypothetical protein